MIATKHTPGPWYATEWSCHAKTTVVAPVSDKVAVIVAECSGHGRDASDSLADACLIAAAPELLEALEAITATSTLQTTEAFTAAIKQAEAAIRKAKGE